MIRLTSASAHGRRAHDFIPVPVIWQRYPGNINVLLFDAEKYLRVLEAKKGAISEFVNPKYNPDKKSFKKPTRLECTLPALVARCNRASLATVAHSVRSPLRPCGWVCWVRSGMMQDWPKLLDANAKVGFTQFERWTSFSAVKNALSDGVQKQKDGNAPESAASGEHDMYLWSQRVLSQAGVDIAPPTPRIYRGLQVQAGPKVVLTPWLGVTQQEVRAHFPGGAAVHIGPEATLVLDGDIVVQRLQVDGALVIHAAPGVHVTVDGLTANAGRWTLQEVTDDKAVDQKYAVRGYTLNKQGGEIYNLTSAGQYTLSDGNKAQWLQH